MLDYYKELEISSKSTPSEIKKSYHKLSKKYHPDKNPNKSDIAQKISAEKFKRISEAYAVLSDKHKKAAYDQGIFDPKYPNNAFHYETFFHNARGEFAVKFVVRLRC